MNEDLTLGNLEAVLKKKKNEFKQESQEIKKESLDDFKKSLDEYMDSELHTIEEDMTRRTRNLQKKLSEIRKEIYKEEKELRQTLQEERSQIEEEIESLSGDLTKIRVKQWIIPTIIGASIVIGLGIGSLSLGKWISSQYQEVEELADEIKTQKGELAKIQKTKGKYIVKAWGSHQLGARKKPRVWKDRESGLWVIDLNPKEN